MDEVEQSNLEKETNDSVNTFIKIQYIIQKKKMLS